MTEPTQRDVWNYLREHGPIKDHEVIADALGTDESTINSIVRDLKISGHVSFTLGWKTKANETDELSPLTSPFGAGAGTVSGDKPPDTR